MSAVQGVLRIHLFHCTHFDAVNPGDHWRVSPGSWQRVVVADSLSALDRRPREDDSRWVPGRSAIEARLAEGLASGESCQHYCCFSPTHFWSLVSATPVCTFNQIAHRITIGRLRRHREVPARAQQDLALLQVTSRQMPSTSGRALNASIEASSRFQR